MTNPESYSFSRYLSAKKTVDDRSLNRHVWNSMALQLRSRQAAGALRLLEVGAGIGTMLERMLEWNALSQAEYLAIDQMDENITAANQRLPGWAAVQGYQALPVAGGWKMTAPQRQLQVRFECADVFDFAASRPARRWDVLIAHAFLDLLDIPRALPALFSLLNSGGLFYFTINFDGLTLLEPVIDPVYDEHIQVLYHRTMDQRVTDGLPSGDSRAGRHLFEHLWRAGAMLLDAGASDWVVFPTSSGYPDDEAYFLHFIIWTIDQALHNHPDLEPRRFQRWTQERHAQIERSELVYIAHQLDFLGRWDG
jgi:2-polyprenyl-3-methyl-5-hydroxy-6-metoxy-1,4-benzoquinol methylase